LAAAAAALLVTGCKTPTLPPPGPAPPGSIEDLGAAVAADAKRSDAETDSKIRAELADDAERHAQACLAQAPQAAACLYYHAISLGLQARAHPLRANDALKGMLDALAGAETADPGFDHAGPSRVKALVLVKAPAWPLGPGDAEAGLASARRAVSLRPDYPPNVLALAEAQTKNGDAKSARAAYGHARELAQALPSSGDRDDWLREAQQGSGKLPPSQ
jgi:hypothetical protein